MVTYVVLATFTDQGIRNAKESPKRAEAFEQLAKTFGVTVREFFWTQGQYDCQRRRDFAAAGRSKSAAQRQARRPPISGAFLLVAFHS